MRSKSYSLARPIVSDDEGQGGEDLDGLAACVVERTDSVVVLSFATKVVTLIDLPKNGKLVDLRCAMSER